MNGQNAAKLAPGDVALVRVVPQVIPVLDCTLGFAHTDPVTP